MEIMIRSVIIFSFLFVLTRAMGKKELAELSAFELILLVTIGDLVQQGVTQEDMSLTGAMLAVGTIAFLIIVLSYTAFRWKVSRPVVEGLPVIIIRDGGTLPEALRIERLTTDEVIGEARQQGIGDLRDIRLGILEPDGKFSFIRTEGTPATEEGHRSV
jgi:uncharacterized membrane protein YcaP (DUF421 family)